VRQAGNIENAPCSSWRQVGRRTASRDGRSQSGRDVGEFGELARGERLPPTAPAAHAPCRRPARTSTILAAAGMLRLYSGRRDPTLPLERQTDVVLEQIKLCLEAAGSSSTPRVRSSGAITGKRPATPSWSAPFCTFSTPNRKRRSRVSPTSCPIRGTDQHDVERDDDHGATGLVRASPGDRFGARELLNKSDNERSVARDVVPRALP
jgi:hypothetical protein